MTPETEYSRDFLNGMVARMGFSFHKYGPIAEAYPEKVNAIASLLCRLAKYVGTERLKQIVGDVTNYDGDGNTEWLMDVGNFAMIEFMHPGHPSAHFIATESKDSPGRVRQPDEWDGSAEVSSRSNDYGMQPVEGRS